MNWLLYLPSGAVGSCILVSLLGGRCLPIVLEVIEDRRFVFLCLFLSSQIVKEANVALSRNRRCCMLKRLEVDPTEERMGLQVGEVEVRTGWAGTESHPWVLLEELVDYADSFRLKVVRESQVALSNLREDFVLNDAMEGCLSDAHLVNHAAEGPQVHPWRRDALFDHLRGDVEGSAHECIRLAACVPLLVR